MNNTIATVMNDLLTEQGCTLAEFVKAALDDLEKRAGKFPSKEVDEAREFFMELYQRAVPMR